MKPEPMDWFRALLALGGGIGVGVGIGHVAQGLANHQNFVSNFSGLELGWGLGAVLAARELRHRPRD
jgi:hypothetical protein